MNGALLLLVAVACFLGGYFLYARKTEEILGIDPSRAAAVRRLDDAMAFLRTTGDPLDRVVLGLAEK